MENRDGALAAIPQMLPPDPAVRTTALAAIRATVEAGGKLSGERAERLARIETLFALDDAKTPAVDNAAAPAADKNP